MSSRGLTSTLRQTASLAASIPRRKLGKVRPLDPALIGNRAVHCSLCGRKIFSALLLAHKQTVHGDAVYSRPPNGRPKNIWFGLPTQRVSRTWRRPAALRPICLR